MTMRINLSPMKDWVRRLRRRYNELKLSEGLTQESLAERLQLSQGAISHWLNGRREPDTLQEYEKLAGALRVDPAWLLYGIGAMSQSARRLHVLLGYGKNFRLASVPRFEQQLNHSHKASIGLIK